ncbi:hypothetical protein [Antricoccus suffuscus]|uniref:hypothetical protein n=1 Tax=Antricoccus suffuscus TaxID=1629062 RepID=UPI000D04D7A9|nr:hypothetical protein [Antricoccus suffuscus]
MGRRNRPKRAVAPPLRLGDSGSIEEWMGDSWRVRRMSGSSAVKTYRCPGCDQTIPIGLAHVVVWPVDDTSVFDRRHWHAACWQSRDRRTPGVQRSRNAPRYGRDR